MYENKPKTGIPSACAAMIAGRLYSKYTASIPWDTTASQMASTLARSYSCANAPVSHSTSSKLRTGFLPAMPSFSARGNVLDDTAMGSPSGDGTGS